jgi:ABC-type multidrug transport system fused ATPase/permease subunit
MSQQFARMPTDASEVVREVRGLGGVPWRRLFGYLRPHWRPFAIALAGLSVSSAIGLAFPLIIAGITTQVVAGGDAGGLDRLLVILLGLFVVQAAAGFVQTYSSRSASTSTARTGSASSCRASRATSRSSGRCSHRP